MIAYRHCVVVPLTSFRGALDPGRAQVRTDRRCQLALCRVKPPHWPSIANGQLVAEPLKGIRLHSAKSSGGVAQQRISCRQGIFRLLVPTSHGPESVTFQCRKPLSRKRRLNPSHKNSFAGLSVSCSYLEAFGQYLLRMIEVNPPTRGNIDGCGAAAARCG